MVDLTFFMATAAGAMTLMVLPVFCLYDWKTRKIPDAPIALYALGSSPGLALYFLGLPLTYLGISLVMCGIWILIRKLGAWGGADTKFLMIFSLCCPLNPLNLYQQTFQISFLLVLGGVMIVLAGLVGPRKDLPLMLPIAAAVIMTMLIGVLL